MYNLDFTAKRGTGGIAANHSLILHLLYQMLYLLPNELLVVIVEYCDHETRKNLSLVSRRLRNPSQCVIFKTVRISSNTVEIMVAVKGGGHLPEVFQNNRLLSYIQTFVISPGTAYHHLGTGIMVSIFTALYQMQPLRDIKLVDVPFTTTMLDRLCEVLSNRLYNLELQDCSYPADYTIQQAALKIHRLLLRLGGHEWVDTESPPTMTNALVAIIQRSLSSIATLILSSGLSLLPYLGTMPRLTSLETDLGSKSEDEGLRNFLVANPQLVEFTPRGPFYGFSPLPPSALPNLTTIRTYNFKAIHQLISGRPVAKVEIRKLSTLKTIVKGLRALSHSTAPIVELTIPLHHHFTHLNDVLGAVVKAAPRLERMSLSFRAEVRRILY